MSDRVSERRLAAQLARHYRDQENLTIAEIARRLGRAEATVKAYLYDPSDDNKRPTDTPRAPTWASALRAPAGRCLRGHKLASGVNRARYVRRHARRHGSRARPSTTRGELAPDGFFLRLSRLSSTSGRLGF